MTPVTDPALLSQLEGGGQKPVTDPALIAQLEQAPTTNAQADPVMDVVKSGASGLGRGAIGVLGLPGDIGSLVSSGADAVAGRLGLTGQQTLSGLVTGQQPDNSGWQNVKNAARLAVSMSPAFRPFATNPGSQAIQSQVEQHTGEFYKPQTTAGKYVGTVGEFAPAAALPGGMMARATRAVVPGVSSEAAGQATEGTRAEPYARMAAALAGGSFANAAAPTAKVAAPIRDALKGAAVRTYKDPAVTGAPVTPTAAARLGDDIAARLTADGGRPRNMPEVFSALDEFKNLGPRPTVADVRSVRENLSAIAQNKIVTAPKEARFANEAVRDIDRFLDGVSPQLRDANANYAASMRSRTVANALTRAERAAESANSGQNIDNATRQQFKAILNSDKRTRGFSPDELAQMERVVRGTTTGNTARYLGNLLGGGGGLGQLVTAGVLGGGGYAAGGEQGMLAGLGLAAGGRMGKALANRSTLNQANKLDEMVRSRSPLFAATKAAAGTPRITQEQRNALIAQMLLAADPQIKQTAYQPR